MMRVGKRSGGNLSVDVVGTVILGRCIRLDKTCADGTAAADYSGCSFFMRRGSDDAVGDMAG